MGAIQQWLHQCLVLLKPQKRLKQGEKAELFAAHYLQQQGLKLIQKNFNSKIGEIDLIMKDQQTLVFVEVKYRARDDWANATETVTASKQQKIIRTAQLYLQQKKITDQVACRFDVLAIDKNLTDNQVNWIQHAFY